MTPKHNKHEQAKWIRDLRATDEGRRLLEEERVVFEAMEAIAELMQSQGVSRSQLAERLGKSAAFVTKLLSGENNFTLRTLADVYFALGRSVHVTHAPVGDRVRVSVAADMRNVCIDPPQWSGEAQRSDVRAVDFGPESRGRRHDPNDPNSGMAA
jgi:transcriptional regulator with XRE-family HTH domain